MKKTLSTLLLLTLISQNAIAIEELKNDYKDINKTLQGSIEERKILNLKDCIEIALDKSPLITSAQKNTKAYQSRIGQAKAAYFPELRIQSGVNKRNQVSNDVTRFMDRDVKNYTLVDTGVTQQIYDFGKTRANVNIQKASYEYSLAQLDDTVDKVVYKVKEAYYYLLYSVHQYNVAKQMVKQFEEHLKQAEAFYEIGTKPKLDVTIAKVNLKDAKLNEIKAENQVKVATAALNNVMGTPFIKPYDIKNELKFKKYDINFAKAYEIAKAHRPALKAAEEKINIANESVRFAKKGYMPKIEGQAGVAKGGSKFRGDDGWDLGIYLKLPVTNAYLTKKQVDEARSLYDKEMADTEKIKQDIYFEVQKSYYNLVEAAKRIPVSKEGIVQAKESFDLANGRYRVGLGDPIELKDAEITYQNSQLDYYQSLYEYNKALSEFERVIGASLDKAIKENI